MRFRLFAVVLTLSTLPAAAQDWMVVDPGQGLFALTSGSTGAAELSGLAWSGGNQYYAVGDDAADLFPLSITVDPNDGTIGSATLSNPVAITGSDLEGLASLGTGGNVVVSDEVGPALRVHNPSTGALVQSITIPSVFSNIRSNLSFEAVAWEPSSQVLWATNEEALSVDGPVSGFSEGTVIRLQQFDDTFSASGQWAYVTDPLPGDVGNPGRDLEVSGVPSLVPMPGGALLVLERAVGNSALVRHRLYQVDFSGATDTSGIPSLDGATYTAVGKRLIWSHEYLLTNFEGATLGATLNDGSRSLLLVADDGGGLLQALVALTLRVVVCGDSLVGGDEQCDDGNLEDGDGCDAACRIEVCGDGIVNNAGTEACDDGNLTDGDGCSSACQLERGTTKCQEAIAKAGRSYYEARTKSIQKCRRSMNKGKSFFQDPEGTIPVADPNDCALEYRSANRILRAAVQAHKKIAKKCSDATVGLLQACADRVDGLVDEGGSGCLTATHAAAADEMIDAQHGGLVPLTAVEQRKCQEAIAKAGSSYARALVRALQSCRNKLNKGKVLYVDVDKTQQISDPAVCANEVKTARKLRRAAQNLRRAIAKRCSSPIISTLATACATTLDGLIDVEAENGCLLDGHDTAVDAMIDAQY